VPTSEQVRAYLSKRGVSLAAVEQVGDDFLAVLRDVKQAQTALTAWAVTTQREQLFLAEFETTRRERLVGWLRRLRGRVNLNPPVKRRS